MDLAAEHPLHQVAGHLLIAIAAVNPSQEAIGEHQAFHKLLDSDLATAQLGLQGAVAIRFKGVEEELAVGPLNQGVHGAAAEAFICRGQVAGFITSQHHAIDAGVLG